MSSTVLIQIVPTLLPHFDGLGDAALRLAEALRPRGIETVFVVTDGEVTRGDSVLSFVTHTISRGDGAKLRSLLDSYRKHHLTVATHYVGYGYSEKGCPLWLVTALEGWHRASRGAHITLFHELWATSTPWHTPFWLYPIQRQIVKRLLRISTHAVSHQQATTDHLAALLPDSERHPGRLITLPVFSTVGECEVPTPLKHREGVIVVFGTPGRRVEAYTHARPIWSDLRDRFGINEIIDIGDPLPSAVDAPLHCTVAGPTPPDKVCEYLRRASFGLIDYPASLLPKSGIFAAYAAFGVVPIVVTRSVENTHGLELSDGHHYLTPQTLAESSLTFERLQIIATSAHSWYSAHNVSSHAEIFFHWCLRKNLPQEERHVIR